MVKRYKFIHILGHDNEREYVDAEDYAALEAECERLREENKMLKDNLEEIEERARLLLKREPT